MGRGVKNNFSESLLCLFMSAKELIPDLAVCMTMLISDSVTQRKIGNFPLVSIFLNFPGLGEMQTLLL